MKFTINKTLLCKKLQIVSRAVSSKTTFPALSGLLIEADEENLIITGSNGDLSIKIIINDPMLQIEEPGKMLVDSQEFNERIRKSLSEEIKLTNSEDDKVLVINSGSSTTTLYLMETEDYPEIKFPISANPVKMSAAMMKDIVRKTTFAANPEAEKEAFRGVNFEIDNNLLCCTATNSFRLSKFTVNLDFAYPTFQVTIPAKSLNELAKIMNDSFSLVEMHFSNERVIFKIDDYMFQSKLISTKFPNTKNLVPSSFQVIAEFDKQDFIDSIDQASITDKYARVSIDENDVFSISSSSSKGNYSGILSPLNVSISRPFKIAFESSILIEAAKAFDGDKVVVKFSGERSAAIFENEVDAGLIEFVLPRSQI